MTLDCAGLAGLTTAAAATCPTARDRTPDPAARAAALRCRADHRHHPIAHVSALAVALGLALAAAPALAQQSGQGAAQEIGPASDRETAQIAADSVTLDTGGRLVAEGRVEILYRSARLRAARLVLHPGTGGAQDRVDLTGPILLEDGDSIVILAEAADLSADLRDGVLRGARMVLDRRLQLAATGMAREDGRITRVERVAASSCQVCPGGPPPLWDIRAARVTHDAEARTLLFEDAAFQIRGRTVAGLPRLRLPDPTVDRLSGWLAPELRGTTALGPGIVAPFFLALGPHRDLTLLPRLHARGSQTLGARYRQAFALGQVQIDGALTRDRLRPGRWRAFAAVEGRYALAPGTALGLSLDLASDAAYRADYGLGEDEFRTNTIFLEQVRRDRLGRLRLTAFRSLRDGDDNARLPNRVLEAGVARRVSPPGLGGTAWLRFDALAAKRRSDEAGLGAGRDLARLSLLADWRRDWVLGPGLQVAALGTLQADHWQLRQDDRFGRSVSRIHPAAAAELRWPLVRHGAGGASQLLEPVAQIAWAPRAPRLAPTEEGRLAELDEITLFRLQRGPGLDRLEGGLRANVGLAWTRHDPAGWSLGAQAGRVFRADAQPAAAPGSAAADLRPGPVSGFGTGRRSDYVATARLDLASGLAIAGRAVITPSGRTPREEVRLAWAGPLGALAADYLQLAADPAQGRIERTSELGLGGTLVLDGNWSALADLRYDLARSEPGIASLGARFRNECLAVDLSVSRRFVSTLNVAPRTDFGVQVDLIGFGNRPGGPARRCGG
ncbi:MAG: LPS-assembly protein LptD [Alkalilacustris sp.]